MEEVSGSIPLGSTIQNLRLLGGVFVLFLACIRKRVLSHSVQVDFVVQVGTG